MMIKITNKTHILYERFYKVLKETESHYIVRMDIGNEIKLSKLDCERMEGYNE